MKKSDSALIVLGAVVSVVVAFFLGKMFFNDPAKEVETIEYLEPISSDLKKPSADFFNIYAVNPTVDIIIGSCNEGQGLVWDPAKKQCVKADELEKPSEGDESAMGGEEGENGHHGQPSENGQGPIPESQF